MRSLTRLGTAVAMAAASLCLAVPVGGAMGATPAGAAVRAPHCPPECGSVAAGDPLLVPYVTVNPGLGWLALPDTQVQDYVDSLKHNVSATGQAPGAVNVAAAKWLWINGRFGLLVALVSSSSLSRLHLDNPTRNAGDLCNASRGVPRSQLVPVPGIPGAVSGLCALPSDSSNQGATIVAFDRGNVAALIEITSRSDTPIDRRTTEIAARQQYQALPADGVLVSHGVDVELVALWMLLLALVVLCAVRCARRRGSWRGPFDAVAGAFGRRRLALGVAVVGVVGAMAFAMVDSSLLHGSGQWYEASFNDFWRNWADGAYTTFGGGYAHLYSLDQTLETAPALQVLIAPVARLAFSLPFPNPSVVLYPEAFWVAGPLFLGAMALPICAGDRWVQYMEVTAVRTRLAVLGVMAVTLPPIALFGHPEDLIALGAMLYGLLAAMEGRHRAAGWWLGVALAFQFFAFLAVPLALVFLTRKQWWPSLVRMAVVPLGVLAVPLVSAPATTIGQLLHQKVFDDFGYISPTWYLDPGVGAFVRVLVALAAVPAALVVARFLPEDRRDAANLVLWVLALLFALRVLEPELVPYFLAPTLALLPISASRGGWPRLGAACLVAVWLNWWVHVAVQGRWSLWLILVAQLGLLGWLAWPSSRPVAHPRKPVGRSARGRDRDLVSSKSRPSG